MCGITAFFAPDGAITGPEVDAATAVLKHRGPDDRGVWISPDRRVGLSHARLSIIDLAGGHQPLANEDETMHLVANGEFYDFERIRKELEARGHRFRTKSDSEIAIHLYEEHGIHGLTQLRGEFAFVIWDARNQTLVAARDRFGIKPLFYAEHEGRLLVASEVKALFAAGIPARWDSAMLHQWSTGALLPDRSLFAGVHQVPPGHYLLATRGSLRLHRYWDLDYPATGEPGPRQDLNAWAEEFRAAFDEAVRLRLRADVPVGCYLSGGIDSAAVLGFAARHSRQPIRAFTLSFDHEAYDERQLAQEMAALAGADFVPIPIRQSDLAAHFHDAIWNAETLFINGHGVAKYLLSRAVRDAGYKVVLTGEGSDEIFGGYAHFRRDILLYDADGQDPGEVQRLLKQLEDSNPVSRGLLLPSGENLSLDATRSTLGYVPSWFETFASAAAKRQSLFSAAFRSQFAGHDAWRIFLNGLDVPGQLTGRAPLHQSLYLWAKSLLPNYILTVLGDRMEMAHSIEGRLPFLDHHLVELVTRMPPAVKIRGLTEKLVLREAARARITDAIWRRQKHPFLAPPMTLKQDEPLNALMQDTLRGEALRNLPGYDRSQVIGLLDRLPQLDAAERTAWDPVLMTILSACALQERFRLTA